MPFSWWLSGLKKSRSARRKHRPARRLPSLRLEQLEERTLLSVQPITLADPSFFGNSGFGLSGTPSASSDGQRIVFESAAPNLVPGDNNASTDVFLYDRGTGRVSLISANITGTGTSTGPANRGAHGARITPDGRYVVFLSTSNDLVFPAVNHPVAALARNDVYVRDLQTGVTTLISRNLAGDNDGNSNSINPSLSDDGQLVAFQSDASDLVANDTNGATDVFIRNWLAPTPTTTRVSASSTGAQGNRPSTNPVFSGNGQFVVFQSDADNFDSRDNNTATDIFLRNLAAGTTRLVTADVTGTASANAGSSRLSRQPISADGRYVVFHSGATNLVPQSTAFQTNAFVRDTQTESTRLLSINRAGTGGSNGTNVIVTSSGQFAAWVSTSDNVASDVTDSNGRPDAYLSTITPTTITNRLVSVNSAGTNGGNGDAVTDVNPERRTLQVSPDGRFVAFANTSTNLTDGVTDTNNALDVFLRDMQTNLTRAVSVVPGTTATGNGAADTVALSNDGRLVAFAGQASNLVPGDGNRQQDVFLRDLQDGTTELASRRSPLLPAEFTANLGGELLDISADGRHVLFWSHSANLLPAGVGINFNVFMRDRQTGSLQAVSVRPDGTLTSSFGAGRISADGRFVVFASSENNLDSTITGTNGGLYLRDLLTGVTRMISRNTTSGAPANNSEGNTEFAISADNRYVAFTYRATNLVSGVTVPASQANLYLYDRQTNTLRLVSVNSAGTASGNGNTHVAEYNPQFSADGRKLIYSSLSSDLIAGVTDTNNNHDVFVYDTASQTNSLVSVSTTPNTTANNQSGGTNRPQQRVSAEGRYVIFTSLATNLTAQGTNNRRQVYVRDLLTATTTMLSVSDAGTAGNTDSLDPVISSDGQRVLFTSTATNLVTLPTGNFVQQVYVRDRVAGTTRLVSLNATGTAGGNQFSGPGVISADPHAVLSADGRYAAFSSRATDLVSGFVDANGAASDLFVRDLQTGVTVLASVSYSGTSGANLDLGGNLLLLAGGTGVFDSSANNLFLGDRNDIAFSSTIDVYAFTFGGGASFSGTVFNDANGSGTQDGSEPGLPVWAVFLDANGNRRRDSGEDAVTTDNAGNYRFTNLAPGTYTAAVVLDDGFIRTVPTGLTGTYTVSLPTPTSSPGGINFGARVAPADLDVGLITVPATAQPGQTVSVSWTVHNQGSNALSSSWQDAIYLSKTSTLDASALLLATVPHVGGLAAQRSYTATANVTLPAALPGSYFFHVATDRRFQVTNENNRANNLRAADTPTVLAVPTLTLGTPTAGQFTARGCITRSMSPRGKR